MLRIRLNFLNRLSAIQLGSSGPTMTIKKKSPAKVRRKRKGEEKSRRNRANAKAPVIVIGSLTDPVEPLSTGSNPHVVNWLLSSALDRLLDREGQFVKKLPFDVMYTQVFSP